MRSRARCATATGSSAGAWRPRRIRRASCRRRRRATLRADGTALVQAGTQDIGTGTYTVMTQIAADALGVPVEQGHVRARRHDAARGAALGRLDDRGEGRLGGEARVHEAARGDEARSRPATSSPQSTARRSARTTRSGRCTRSARCSPRSASTRISGPVRVARVVAAYAAGKILNAKTARSQLIGGIVWGDRHGADGAGRARSARPARVITRDLADYHVPVNADVPDDRRHPASTRPTRTSTRSARRASARSASPARARRSRTRSSTRPASACATCRSRLDKLLPEGGRA